jgi:energy-converting hydrogenase Eha subunit F
MNAMKKERVRFCKKIVSLFAVSVAICAILPYLCSQLRSPTSSYPRTSIPVNTYCCSNTSTPTRVANARL